MVDNNAHYRQLDRHHNQTSSAAAFVVVAAAVVVADDDVSAVGAASDVESRHDGHAYCGDDHVSAPTCDVHDAEAGKSVNSVHQHFHLIEEVKDWRQDPDSVKTQEAVTTTLEFRLRKTDEDKQPKVLLKALI